MMKAALIRWSANIQNFANGQTSYFILWAPGQKGIQAKLLDASKVEVVEVPFPIFDSVKRRTKNGTKTRCA